MPLYCGLFLIRADDSYALIYSEGDTREETLSKVSGMIADSVEGRVGEVRLREVMDKIGNFIELSSYVDFPGVLRFISLNSPNGQEEGGVTVELRGKALYAYLKAERERGAEAALSALRKTLKRMLSAELVRVERRGDRVSLTVKGKVPSMIREGLEEYLSSMVSKYVEELLDDLC